MNKIVWHAFWAGFIVAFSIIGLVQDWFGLDGYINYLKSHWVDLHWSWWIPGIVYFFYKFIIYLKISAKVDRLSVRR